MRPSVALRNAGRVNRHLIQRSASGARARGVRASPSRTCFDNERHVAYYEFVHAHRLGRTATRCGARAPAAKPRSRRPASENVAALPRVARRIVTRLTSTHLARRAPRPHNSRMTLERPAPLSAPAHRPDLSPHPRAVPRACDLRGCITLPGPAGRPSRRPDWDNFEAASDAEGIGSRCLPRSRDGRSGSAISLRGAAPTGATCPTWAPTDLATPAGGRPVPATALRVEGARLYFGAASALLRRSSAGPPRLDRARGRAAHGRAPHAPPGVGAAATADVELQAVLATAAPASAGRVGRAILDAVRRTGPRAPAREVAAVVRGRRRPQPTTWPGRAGRRFAACGPVAGRGAVRAAARRRAIPARRARASLWRPTSASAPRGSRPRPPNLRGAARSRTCPGPVRPVAHHGAARRNRARGAAAVWRLRSRRLSGRRRPFGRLLRPAGADLIVVLRDGEPVAAGLLDRDVLADLAADDAPPLLPAGEANAFVAEQTLERDEGRAPLRRGEEDLETVARGEHGERTLSADEMPWRAASPASSRRQGHRPACARRPRGRSREHHRQPAPRFGR